jgi:hypothetical protein
MFVDENVLDAAFMPTCGKPVIFALLVASLPQVAPPINWLVFFATNQKVSYSVPVLWLLYTGCRSLGRANSCSCSEC